MPAVLQVATHSSTSEDRGMLCGCPASLLSQWQEVPVCSMGAAITSAGRMGASVFFH
jgi:hypothetical protein